jgi:hypothetical protein
MFCGYCSSQRSFTLQSFPNLSQGYNQHSSPQSNLTQHGIAPDQLMEIPGAGQSAVCIYIWTSSCSYQAVCKSDHSHLQTLLRCQTSVLDPLATSIRPWRRVTAGDRSSDSSRCTAQIESLLIELHVGIWKMMLARDLLHRPSYCASVKSKRAGRLFPSNRQPSFLTVRPHPVFRFWRRW